MIQILSAILFALSAHATSQSTDHVLNNVDSTCECSAIRDIAHERTWLVTPAKGFTPPAH